MTVRKTGDWAMARRMLASAPLKLKKAAEAALRQEAHELRKEIVQGLTRQAPGGQAIKPLSPLTLAARRRAGFRGTKALIRRGDLRGAIAVVMRGSKAFIGVPRKARGKDGKPVIDVAELNEFGSDPIVIPMTPRMRRYLFALMRDAGVERKVGARKGVVVTSIPARPFLRPAFRRFKKGAQKRFLERLSKRLVLGRG